MVISEEDAICLVFILIVPIPKAIQKYGENWHPWFIPMSGQYFEYFLFVGAFQKITSRRDIKTSPQANTYGCMSLRTAQNVIF